MKQQFSRAILLQRRRRLSSKQNFTYFNSLQLSLACFSVARSGSDDHNGLVSDPAVVVVVARENDLTPSWNGTRVWCKIFIDIPKAEPAIWVQRPSTAKRASFLTFR